MPVLSLNDKRDDNVAPPLTITGVVHDVSGQALAGVTVLVKGTQHGTQTDVNGKFSIDVNVGEVLTFAYIGYVKKEVTIATPGQLTVTLDVDSKQLSEVVVTALGIKKERKSLGYSVTELKGSELTTARETNFANELEGKVAGLNVTRYRRPGIVGKYKHSWCGQFTGRCG